MIGSTRLKYDYLSNVSLIKKALEMQGHEVDIRKVPLDEMDITKKYDIALVGLAQLYSIGAGYYPEAMRVLDLFGQRACLYADDWAFVGFGETARGTIRGWERYLGWRKFSHDKRHLDVMKMMLEAITGQSKELGDTCPWPIMLPMFHWGNIIGYMENNLSCYHSKLLGYDPSHLYEMPKFHLNLNKEGRIDKNRNWVLATLQNHDNWLKKQNFKWPLLAFGNKRKGEQVLTEDQIIQQYAENWGVLAPKYPKAGMGWWRVRFIHAVETDSVLLCDPQDGQMIGPSFVKSSEQIEQLTDAELERLSLDQFGEFWYGAPKPEKVSNDINEFLRKHCI